MKLPPTAVSCVILALLLTSDATRGATPATRPVGSSPATPLQTVVGEQVPSEDSVIKDLHSLGLIEGKTDVFRCACPVRDLAREMATTQPGDSELIEATSRLRHLRELGIHTIISFQSPAGDEGKKGEGDPLTLERLAAEAAGIRFVSHPINNAGPNSLQTMTDQQVIDAIDPIAREILNDAKTGGVVFHCSAGHDRTGIVAAYLRLKYEHWTADAAIAEMRRYGHNWKKFSDNGGVSSWHERHVRGIATLLDQVH